MSLAETSDDTGEAGLAESRGRHIEAFVTDHYPFVWRLFRRLGLSAADAEDAAQQVFMIAARKLAQFPDSGARSFLYATALRVASNQRRGQRRREQLAGALARGHREAAADPEQDLALKQAYTLLDELLAQLPASLRRILILAEVEELEVAEVAALERIPRGTAASRLRRGRQLFGELLAAAAARNPLRRSP